MARGNKFKRKPAAVVAVAVEEEEVKVAAAVAPVAAQPPPAAPPARDRTHAASTTAAAKPPPAGAGAKRKAGQAAAPAKAAPAAAPPAPKRLAVPTLVAPPTPASGAASPAAPVGAANWLALKAAAAIGKKHGGGGGGGGKKQKKEGGPHPSPPSLPTTTSTPAAPPALLPAAIGSTAGATRVLAMDCEMVGVGPGGARSALARVCLVNEAGHILLDTHVSPRERVTDHRTHVSGVAPAHLRGAPDLDTVRARVERLLDGRVLVGHALAHDLAALMVSHPRAAVRDTARYPPFMRATAPGRKPKPRRLRDLAAEVLGLAIQGGAHSPVDDARAALYLYQAVRREWEAAARKPGGVAKHLSPPVRAGGRTVARAPAEEAAARLGDLAAADEMADL